jgi:hypothetical protein
MPYQGLLRTAEKLVDEVVAELAKGRPASEVVEILKAAPNADLLRARRVIDQRLASRAPAPAVQVVVGGIPFGELIADLLDLDLERAHRMVVFIEEYGYVMAERGHEPTIPELAIATIQSIATINRRLADFRSLFPAERNPGRIARLLRDALNDERLWGSVDESIEASLRDVPVVANATDHELARVVAALEDASNALNGTAVGAGSLHRYMSERGMEVPKNPGVLEAILRRAWTAGLIMRATNGVYTALDGTGRTEWDRPLSDYYIAADQGFPLPGSWPPAGRH